MRWVVGAATFVAIVGLCASFLIVMAQIIGRLIGIVVPSADVIAGYLIGCSVALALAGTTRRGAHIRVTLGIDRLESNKRRRLEIACCVVAAGISGVAAAGMTILAAQSYSLDARAVGLIAIPLVIPQGCIALGLWLWSIQWIEECIRLIKGMSPHYHGTPRVTEEP